MAGAWVVKCSMAVGAVLALASCGGDYEGDPRSSSEMLTMYAARSDEIATNEAGLEAEEDYLEEQAEMYERSCRIERARGDENPIHCFD